jgi:hypothetical protein
MDIWREILSYSILPTTSLVCSCLDMLEKDLYSYRKSMMMSVYEGKIENAILADDWESASFIYYNRGVKGFNHITRSDDVIRKTIDSGRIDLAMDIAISITPGEKDIQERIKIQRIRMSVVKEYIKSRDIDTIIELIKRGYLHRHSFIGMCVVTNNRKISIPLLVACMKYIDDVTPAEMIRDIVDCCGRNDKVLLLEYLHSRGILIEPSYMMIRVSKVHQPNVYNWLLRTFN